MLQISGTRLSVSREAPAKMISRSNLLWILWASCCISAPSQTLQLPARSTNALTGSQFVSQISPLTLADREHEIVSQIISGNVPNFLRKLCPIQITNTIEGKTNFATFNVTPDYLAVGSDDDYFLTPISPNSAQILADRLGCSLPTRKMVDAIYNAAEVKLAPLPIPPSAAMTSVDVFDRHNSTVRAQRAEYLKAHPLGALVAGHQKDVVISARLTNAPGKVAIYGWHQTNAVPIQPLYLGHNASWVDYSQCTRLVLQALTVNCGSQTVSSVLSDPSLAALLSDEGVISNARYPTNAPASIPVRSLDDFAKTPHFNERSASFTIEPGVKVYINAPGPEAFSNATQTNLILYALPNGNTTAQTLGRATNSAADWRYDIQHIAAQTRFLRKLLPDNAIVLACLENDLQSWPSWRKKYGDKSIPEIIATVQKIVARPGIETVLSAHSGGGSFIFGYLNAVETVPDNVTRIAFLDSNYAYDRKLGHKDKIAKWLAASRPHYLCVLAYDDASALLDGKPFVSAAGGTWGRSHAMQKDLAEDFQFNTVMDSDFEKYTALNGRLQFLLKPNPEKQILHTKQVELNGFIHCMVTGTLNESKGYEYFGPRAYSKWILPSE